MKHFSDFFKKAAAILFAVLLISGAYTAEAGQTGETALNTAGITYEQLALCRTEELDGFEADGTVRSPLFGAALYTGGAEEAFTPLEGGSMLLLSGEGKVGAELSFLKHPPVSGSRSIAVSVYVKPAETETRCTLSVSATFTNAEVSGSDELEAGSWQTAYLPVSQYNPGQLVSVKVTVESSEQTGIEAALDCLHMAAVDGMPEDLPLFASDFTCFRGKISYSDRSLVFNVNGADGYIESSACNYIITEKTNTLAVTVDNGAGAKKAVLYCKMNGSGKYTDASSFERKLDGSGIYYFKIGSYRGENVLNGFKIEFPGKLKGEITIKKIELTSYRYPASYPGTLTVSESGNDLTVSGSVRSYPASSKEIRLYRLLPGQDEERFEELDAAPYRTAEPAKTFSFVIPKDDNGTDNTLYKYFAVYYGDSAYYAAPAAYAPIKTVAAKSTGLKCVSYSPDLSLLTRAEPDTVFFTFDAEKVFGEDGSANEEYLAEYDLAAERLYEEGISAAAVVSYPSGSPDLSAETAFSSYVSLLRFIAERYKNVLKAVVPCAELDSESASDSAGSDDRAVRYAAALARTASAVLTPYGVNVLLPLSSGCETRFILMLGEENLSGIPFGFLLYGGDNKTPYGTGAAPQLSAQLTYKNAGREILYGAKLPDSEEDFIMSFYLLTSFCSGVYYDGAFADNGVPELFRAADSSDGAAEADGITEENGGVPVSLLYPHVSNYKKIYRRTEPCEDKPEGSVSILFDGKADERWKAYDACHDIYQGAVNSEPAAELAFDFSLAERGKAVFIPEPTADNGAFYIRIYADYLPADESRVTVTVYIYGDNGCVYSDITLNESENAAVCVKTDETLGTVRKIAFYAAQNEAGALSTPRICVEEIYAADVRSDQTVTEAPETEPLKPETQVFVTEQPTEPPATEPADDGDGTVRLLIITLSVMLGMFVCCGLIIFILKKISDKDRK